MIPSVLMNLGFAAGAASVIVTGDVSIVLQRDAGAGFVDVDGTQREITIASGFGNIGFADVVLDISAGDKFQVLMTKNGGGTYTIYPNMSLFSMRYL